MVNVNPQYPRYSKRSDFVEISDKIGLGLVSYCSAWVPAIEGLETCSAVVRLGCCSISLKRMVKIFPISWETSLTISAIAVSFD